MDDGSNYKIIDEGLFQPDIERARHCLSIGWADTGQLIACLVGDAVKFF